MVRAQAALRVSRHDLLAHHRLHTTALVEHITLQLLVAAALPVFLVIACGAAARCAGLLPPEGDTALVNLTVQITYPCFILRSVLGNPALHRLENVLLPLFYGAIMMLLGMVLAYLLAPWFRIPRGAPRRSFSLAVSIQNYGYLPIPVLHALFPSDTWMGVLFVYSLGLEIVLWTAGAWLMNPTAHSSRRLLNPVILSIILGLLLNATPFPQWCLQGSTEPVARAIIRMSSMLAECAVPLGLVVAGATLCDLLRRPRGAGSPWPAAVGGVIMRLVLLPALMLLVLWLLPPAWVSAEFRHVIAVQAAMPGAVAPMLLARLYGGDESVTLRVLIFTTIASLLSIPLVLQLTLRWTQQ